MLETQIAALTNAVIELTAKLDALNVSAPLPVSAPVPAAPAPVHVPVSTPAPAPAPAPVVVAAAPVAAPAPSISPATGMPPLPTFMAETAQTTNVQKAPFTNSKELIDYAVSSYNTLGEKTGMRIQEIAASMGCKNISEMRPDQYDTFFVQVEALKG